MKAQILFVKTSFAATFKGEANNAQMGVCTVIILIPFLTLVVTLCHKFLAV